MLPRRAIVGSLTMMLDKESHLMKDMDDSRSWWKYRPNIISRIPTGWQFGAWVALLQAGGVLLINTIILIYTATKADGSSSGTVYEGDCNTVEYLTTGIHLVINILSTLLLGASNYVMQSLCAPTRIEVDRAHEQRSWLDIGLQSMRNLGYTSRWKKFIWILLSASSIPLHLFYNSSFFSSVGANIYTPYLAQGPDIQDIAQSNGTFDWDCDTNSFASSAPCPEPSAQWELLSTSDCIQAYAVDFLPNRGDLIIVTNFSINDPHILVSGAGLVYGNQALFCPYEWICSGLQGIAGLCDEEDWSRIDPSKWMLDSAEFASFKAEQFQVSYCLSKTLPSRCQLQFNLPLLIIVIILNAGKVMCIAIVATRMKDHPLVTVGDAIASFVEHPDPQTKDMSLVTQQHIKNHSKIQQLIATCTSIQCFPTTQSTIQYNPQRIRWMSTASRRHWMIVGLLFLGAISTILSLLGYAISRLGIVRGISGFASLWQLGLGRASIETLITQWAIPSTGSSGLIASVLVANSPQLILSMIYFIFNSLCTKLCLALEWSSYAHSRKPLRVSYPQGDQRSTYFLQIPYRFGLPLMAYAALLHWLLSQSIFLVTVTYWDVNIISGQFFTCGFSPVGIMLTSIVGASLILSALALGYFKHLNSDMPLVGSCSAAISAACHPPENGSDPLEALQWGVVTHDTYSRDQVGHIGFSSAEVAEPVKGCYYS